jgi:hypothetical protein
VAAAPVLLPVSPVIIQQYKCAYIQVVSIISSAFTVLCHESCIAWWRIELTAHHLQQLLMQFVVAQQ